MSATIVRIVCRWEKACLPRAERILLSWIGRMCNIIHARCYMFAERYLCTCKADTPNMYAAIPPFQEKPRNAGLVSCPLSKRTAIGLLLRLHPERRVNCFIYRLWDGIRMLRHTRHPCSALARRLNVSPAMVAHRGKQAEHAQNATATEEICPINVHSAWVLMWRTP